MHIHTLSVQNQYSAPVWCRHRLRVLVCQWRSPVALSSATTVCRSGSLTHVLSDGVFGLGFTASGARGSDALDNMTTATHRDRTRGSPSGLSWYSPLELLES